MAKQTLRQAAAVPPVTAGPATAVLDHPTPVAAVAKIANAKSPIRRARPATAAAPVVHHHANMPLDEHGSNRQAELFYLQKQIQQQTQMVFILEDQTRIQGVVEWYDRHSIKVRGKSRVLIYKSAIKYLYKAGELGSHSD